MLWAKELARLLASAEEHHGIWMRLLKNKLLYFFHLSAALIDLVDYEGYTSTEVTWCRKKEKESAFAFLFGESP